MHEAIYGRYFRYQALHGPDASARTNLIILPVLLLALNIAAWFMGFRGILFYVVLAVLAAYFYYALWMRPVRMFRAKPGAALQKQVFVFTENGYTRSLKGEEGGVEESTSGRYDALVKVVETAKDFYLYTAPSQALLVDKEYFTEGTATDLRAILQKALGSRFKASKRT